MSSLREQRLHEISRLVSRKSVSLSLDRLAAGLCPFSVTPFARAPGGLCVCQFHERNTLCAVVTGQHVVTSVVHIAVSGVSSFPLPCPLFLLPFSYKLPLKAFANMGCPISPLAHCVDQ